MAQARRPNVIIIFTDDQGIGDVSCYGSEIPTPHIDSIGERGVKFEQLREECEETLGSMREPMSS